jgi:hypothetical protein
MKVLFTRNYWDGPLAGYCEYNNDIYWFDHFSAGGWMPASSYDDDSDTVENECNIIWLPRIFRIYDLDENDQNKLKLVTALFEYECDTTSYRKNVYS